MGWFDSERRDRKLLKSVQSEISTKRNELNRWQSELNKTQKELDELLEDQKELQSSLDRIENEKKRKVADPTTRSQPARNRPIRLPGPEPNFWRAMPGTTELLT